MNKRGDWNALQVFTIIGGIIVGIALVLIVYRISSQERAEMNFYAFDSALLIDSMLSAPGNLDLIQVKEFKKGGFAVLESPIFALSYYGPWNDKGSHFKYRFVPRAGIDIKDDYVGLTIIYLTKKGNELYLNNRLMLSDVNELKQEEQKKIVENKDKEKASENDNPSEADKEEVKSENSKE